MDILKFAFKLLKHGGIFVLRVMGILLPAAFGAFASARARETTEKSHWQKYQEAPYDVMPDGTHYYHDEY